MYSTARFIKPYRDPVHKCTRSRQGFMKWAINESVYYHGQENLEPPPPKKKTLGRLEMHDV